jgi:autotransporter-associated beta strand protein
MKKITLKLCFALAAALLCQSTEAQFTYTGGTLNTAQTYDGLGVDSALNPDTIGTTGDSDYIGSSTSGSLTVLSGTLTINVSDFKVGANFGGVGFLSVGSNANLNILNDGQWGPGVGKDGGSGTLSISNNATVTVLIAGTTEQRFMIGNGAAGGTNANGAINIYGGTMILTNGVTPSEDQMQVRVGSDGGIGTIDLDSGSMIDVMPLPFALGGKYTGMIGTPVFTNQSASRLIINNGSLVMTAICSLTDPNKATFTVASNSYVSFIIGGTGSLSLNNWAATDYSNLVSLGNICVNGTAAPWSDFKYSNSNGQGILQLGNPVVAGAQVSLTNVYAGTPVTLSAAANGLNYQWQTDNGSSGVTWSNIGGATSNNYVLDTTSLLGNYEYQLVVTSGGNSVTSAPVPVTVMPASAPFVVSNTVATPNQGGATVTNYVGGTETFTASFTGTLPINYNWQYSPNANGSSAIYLAGQTNLTLVLTNLQSTNSGYYSLQASNGVSPYVGNSLWLSLTVAPIINELIVWSAPVSVNGLTADQILTNVANTYTNGPGYLLEAAYFGNTTTPILVALSNSVYTFLGDGSAASVSDNISATNGASTNLTGNASFDSVLNMFAYDGGSNHVITLHNLVVGQTYSVQLFAMDDRTNNGARQSNFQNLNDGADVSSTFAMGNNAYVVGTFIAPGTDVAIQQNLPTGGFGNINALVVRALTYIPYVTPTILTQPSPSPYIVYAGRTVTLSGAANGVPTPGYQWQWSPDGSTWINLVNGGRISGATNTTLIVSNITLADNNAYIQFYATNSSALNSGSAFSQPVQLNVLPAPPLSGAVSTNILALNPLAYWPMNDTQDPYNQNAPVYDASGNQHDGEYMQFAQNYFDGIYGPTIASGFPYFTDPADNGALLVSIQYSNSFVSVPGLNLNTNTATFVMWLYPAGTNYPSTGLLMTRDAAKGAQTGGICYDSTGTRIGYNWNGDSFTWGVAGPVIPTNMWSFVAVVITPTNASFYVCNTNGGALKTVTHTHTNMAWTGTAGPDPSIRIGDDNNGNAALRLFNGTIDDVAVYNQSLTANQLMSLVTPSAVILSQPQSAGASAGSLAQFSVGVASSTSVTYQWKTNGVNVGNGGVFSGVTSNVLSISSASLNQNGMVFSVAVNNSVGGVLSSNATLTVIQPLGIAMYWDTNGVTPGSGTNGAPSGIWGTTNANWSLDPTGSSATSFWTNGNSAVFSAGNDQTNLSKLFLVTVTNIPQSVIVNAITNKNGQTRIVGGALTPAGASFAINVATNNHAADYDLRIDSVLNDSGAGTTITKTGPGVLLLETANTFAGGFTLNSGSVGTETANGPFGYGTLTLNGGNVEKSWGSGSTSTLTITNSVNVAGTVNFAIVQSAQGNYQFSGPFTGSGFLAVSNINLGGALTIASGSIIIAGDISQFTGTFFQNCAGSNPLRIGSGSGAIVVNGSQAKFQTIGSTSINTPLALLDANFGTLRMGELSGTGGHIRSAWNSTGNTTFEIGALNTSTTYAGNIDDNPNGANGLAGVTKVGAGTLILSISNSYSGPTTVSNGVLQINTAFLKTNSAVIIASPGVLNLNFSGVDQVNALTLNGVAQANGTYGATGSGAGIIDNTHFAGTGVLQVGNTLPVSYLKFIGSPVLSGTNLSITATNAGAGNVYLLSTTNLTTPRNQWVPVWTNTLTGNGQFTTNLSGMVNPALGQQFYILSTTNNH